MTQLARHALTTVTPMPNESIWVVRHLHWVASLQVSSIRHYNGDPFCNTTRTVPPGPRRIKRIGRQLGSIGALLVALLEIIPE